MNVDLGSFIAGAVVGGTLGGLIYLAIARLLRRHRENLERLPLPDTIVYRNAQAVADWHRKRIEQRISE